MEYRKEIDGLRAVAVVPVVLFHGGFGLFPGGYVGVDVFFVISGYLITSIILADLEKKTFSVAKFYERRIRRIYPALFVVMAACLPMAWYALAPNDLEDFAKSVVAVTVFSSNVLFWTQSGYFDTSAELKPLLHTWSLAVEEQYYLLFPFILATLRSLGHLTLMTVLGAIALTSLLLAEFLVGIQPEAGFYLLPPRAWELLLGAMAAAHVHHRGRLPDGRSLPARIVSLTGMTMIAGSMIGFSAHTPTPSLATLVPTVGTTLVLLFASSGNAVARLLSLRPLVATGLISYSVYLWHQPLFVFARHCSDEGPSPRLYAVLTALTFLLGYLTWAYVEQPARAAKNVPRSALFGMALAGSLAFAAVGALGVRMHGFPGRAMFSDTAIPGYDFDNNRYKARTGDLVKRASGDDPYHNVGSPGDRQRWFSTSDSTIKILIIGNSHATDLYNVFAIRPELFPNMEFARYGVQLSDFGHPEGDRMFDSPNYLAADVVLVSTRWSGFRFEARSRGRSDFNGLEALIPHVAADGKVLAICSEAPHFPQFGSLTLSDSLAIRLSRQRREPPLSPRECIDLVNHRYYESIGSSRRTRETNAALRRISAAQGTIFLDKEDFLCDRSRGTCYAVSENGEKAFWDEAHFTLEGARRFGERVAEIDWLGPVKKALSAERPLAE